MKNRNIEDIDQLFREGLNPDEARFTIPQGEWLKMEQRLDRHDRKRRGMIWLVRLGSVAALLLLFFTLGILITDDVPPVDEKAMVEQKEPTPPVDKPTAKDSLQDVHKAPGGFESDKAVIDPSQHTTPPEQTAYARKRPFDAGQGIASDKNQQKMPSQGVAVESMAENKALQSGSLQKEDTGLENIPQEPVVIAKEQIPPVTETAPPAGEKPSEVEEPVIAKVEEPVLAPEAERRSPRMALSVMAAPAYNAVNSFNNGSVGGDFGLMVTVAIARNWSVSTGGIYAKKLYESGFRDYNPGYNIWHEYYPEKVDADCRVLDIPLNVSYTLVRAQRMTVSMGTGISSYIMLREDYRFTYEETDPDTPLAYSVVNKNRHWLSVVNLQATLEQRLSKKLSVSLQPYLKIPLDDIGFAGVKLQSLGMAAGLNWNLGR